MDVPSHNRLVLACLLLFLGLALEVHAGKSPKEERGPDWAQLTPEQQRILAPLAEEWPKIDGPRRNKWIGIARHYPKMTPQQQERLQSRMKQWASMTPEQRTQAQQMRDHVRERFMHRRGAGQGEGAGS